MKFKNLLFVAICCLAIGNLGVSAQQTYQRCSSMEYLKAQLQADPTLAARMLQVEQFTEQYVQNNPTNVSRSVITIPVVVHVVYNTTAQNISDALIQAQINQLNLDYARLNTDASNTPAAFASVAANTNVQFCLAQRDPNGNATTGIVRKSTTTTSFTTNDNVKYSSKGGDNAWPASSYLNLWVCNLGQSLLGYAQFPGGAAATDGVVILYSSVGSMVNPGSAAPYNYGRTATHEVGHWLNLYHIWGDDNGACTGTDNVNDTPNQGSENYGCPAYPHTDACSASSPGVMFMNYMDYTDDGCMNVFTQGQAARMNALFATGGARVSILSSLGCVPPSATCALATGLSTASVTTTAATFNWTAVSGASSYNVQYRVVGSSTWTNAASSTNSYNASGLTASTNYEWQVQTVCSSGSSAFTASTTFTTATASSCGTAAGLTAGSITNSGAALSWAAVSGATSYNLQWKVSTSSTWTTVSGLTSSSYALSGLASCTAYQYQVQAVCSAGTGAFTSSSTFTTTGCAISYCASKATTSTYEYINKVALGTINNTSGNNGGYADYTAQSTNLAGGSSVTITLTPGYRSTKYKEYWTIYIDYNHNGVFTDAGESIQAGNGNAAVSKSFTVPTTALNGATRMRIQMQYNAYQTNPCASYTYGEVEDYTVNITGNAQRDMNAEANADNSLSVLESIKLYPNPAQNDVTIEFVSGVTGKVNMGVYNIAGQRVLVNETETSEGAQTLHLNTTTLTSGVYIFEIESQGVLNRQKFIISK